jgi:hypothetical protein
LNNGVAELGWVMTLMHEYAYSTFRLDQWEAWCERRRKLALAGRNEDEERARWLKQGLAIVDAKSLFDYLQKESTGGRDRRCAVQVQVIRQAMSALGCQIRWVDHPAMLVDSMTKRKTKRDLMQEFMKHGTVKICAEEDTLQQHQEVLSTGRRLPR